MKLLFELFHKNVVHIVNFRSFYNFMLTMSQYSILGLSGFLPIKNKSFFSIKYERKREYCQSLLFLRIYFDILKHDEYFSSLGDIIHVYMLCFRLSPTWRSDKRITIDYLSIIFILQQFLTYIVCKITNGKLSYKWLIDFKFVKIL